MPCYDTLMILMSPLVYVVCTPIYMKMGMNHREYFIIRGKFSRNLNIKLNDISMKDNVDLVFPMN